MNALQHVESMTDLAIRVRRDGIPLSVDRRTKSWISREFRGAMHMGWTSEILDAPIKPMGSRRVSWVRMLDLESSQLESTVVVAIGSWDGSGALVIIPCPAREDTPTRVVEADADQWCEALVEFPVEALVARAKRRRRAAPKPGEPIGPWTDPRVMVGHTFLHDDDDRFLAFRFSIVISAERVGIRFDADDLIESTDPAVLNFFRILIDAMPYRHSHIRTAPV